MRFVALIEDGNSTNDIPVLGSFNTVVLDLFADVLANDFYSTDALTEDPQTDSMMAMGRRVLQHLVTSVAGDHYSRKTTRRKGGESPHRLVNMIIQIGERAAALLSDPRLEDDEDLREAYTEGAIATLTGLTGTGLLLFLNRRYLAGIEAVDYDDKDAASAVLMVAAYLGRRDHLERLLAIDSGQDINFHCFEKHIWPPLTAACLAGRLGLVEFLLERGADLHIRPDSDRMGWSSVGMMEIAARAGHAHVVDFLIHNNVSATGDNATYAPLAIAAGGRHISTLRLLLKLPNIDLIGPYGVEYSAFFLAIERGYGDILDELLKRKDLDVNMTGTIYGVMDATALAVAAGLGREELFITLFEHPGVDRTQVTVLKAAIEGGNLNILKRIVEEVPECFEECKKVFPAETALCKAAADGTEETVRYLLTVDEQSICRGDLYGRTPLHRAILSGALENVQALLEHPAMDQECFAMADNRGRTCLHHAAESHWNPDTLQALLNRPDPNINARNSFGQTPFAVAAWHGAVDMFKALLAREDVIKYSLDDFGRNPFMNAAAGGAEEIIDIFFQLSLPQTEVWRRDKDNRTALQWAVLNGGDNVVKRLLDPDIGATEEIVRDALRDAETWFARWIEDKEAVWGSPGEWVDWCLEMKRKKKDIIKILSDALEHRLKCR